MFGLIRKAAVQNAGRERIDFPYSDERTAQIFESGLQIVAMENGVQRYLPFWVDDKQIKTKNGRPIGLPFVS